MRRGRRRGKGGRTYLDLVHSRWRQSRLFQIPQMSRSTTFRNLDLISPPPLPLAVSPPNHSPWTHKFETPTLLTIPIRFASNIALYISTLVSRPLMGS